MGDIIALAGGVVNARLIVENQVFVLRHGVGSRIR